MNCATHIPVRFVLSPPVGEAEPIVQAMAGYALGLAWPFDDHQRLIFRRGNTECHETLPLNCRTFPRAPHRLAPWLHWRRAAKAATIRRSSRPAHAREAFDAELLPHFREEEIYLLPRLEAGGRAAALRAP